MSKQTIDADAVRRYLLTLQEGLTQAFEGLDGKKRFLRDSWERAEGGGGEARVLADGGLFERAGVNFSRVYGAQLPPAATKARPELVGRGFEATGVSVVVHPRNPHVPTAHMNVRFLIAEAPDQAPVWWFGGGFDMTPYYPVEADVRHWHRTARAACQPFGDDIYPRFKAACDRYFYLPHRKEARGVGGLFFDDWREPDFEGAFALMRSVGDHFIRAYHPIVEARRNTPYTEAQREFQLMRSGRYVEFNLVHDRGTLFGLQSDGRTESILMSMPPQVSWRYNWSPAPGTPEAELTERYLIAQDWV